MLYRLKFLVMVGVVGLLVGCPSTNPEGPIIEGVIYNDANANGQQEAGEAGLSGWTVYLDTNNDGVAETNEPSTKSNAEGKYRFTKLEPGSYTLRQVMPFGWRNVSGGNAPSFALTATSNKKALELNRTLFNDTPHIVGGVDANVTNFPFIAAIGALDQNGNFSQFCGGALISDTWILTASHCSVDENGIGYDASKVRLGARLGSSDRTQGGQVIEISEVILHPDYSGVGPDGEPDTADDGPPTGYDIALWELAQPVSLAGDLYTLEMLTPELESLTADNTLATAIGWGALFSGGPSPDQLQVVHVPIANPQQCFEANKDIFNLLNFETQICAGVPEGGIDTCQGDSGGPLLVRSAENDRWFHAGATSYGAGCAAPDLYGFYARTSVLSPWVKETAALPSRSYSLSVEASSIITAINFGNVATTRPFVQTIEPRFQLTNLTATDNTPLPQTSLTYRWNIIDEGSSTFTCNLDLDGAEAGQSINVPCQKGANTYTSPAGYQEGVYLPQLTLNKGSVVQSRKALIIAGDPLSDFFLGELSPTDGQIPDSNVIQYVDYYSLDLSGVPSGRAVWIQAQTNDFNSVVAILDGDAPDLPTAIIAADAEEVVFVYNPAITNYTVLVTSQLAEQTGIYSLTTTEGLLTPTTP